jgi:polysaccharide chain length determinant protein (PEP-CTERM system associated)
MRFFFFAMRSALCVLSCAPFAMRFARFVLIFSLCAMRYALCATRGSTMPETEKPLDIHAYIGMALRRKWYIILPFVVCIVGSFGVYKYLPKIYKTTTLILVQPQTVPENYVRSTITDSVVSRLNTISQEILSRTRLENVIQEFNLYADIRNKAPMETIVEMMRKTIEVKVESRSQNERTQNSFSISYEGREPRTVMMVTNKLASLFIEENLRVRESQAERTSEFLGKELSALEEKLRIKDTDIRNIKEKHMGQLPQQLDANLRVLERLQEQLKTTSESSRAAEDRMMLLRNQIETLKERSRVTVQRPRSQSLPGTEEMGGSFGSGQAPEDPVVVQLSQLKRDLTTAQSKYTENHPDVIDLKRKIANLEPRVKEILAKQKAELEKEKAERLTRQKELRTQRQANAVQDIAPDMDPAAERLFTQYSDQYNEAQLESKRLRSEEKNLKEQIAVYQKRIEETPKREQELALLTRDYDLMRTNYQSLLDKRMQAQMAQNLEMKQQGEQFRVLDPARLPEKPVKPDRNKILLMGAVIGLALGFGLVWLRESFNPTFHTLADLEATLGIPVIATLPNLMEEKGRA